MEQIKLRTYAKDKIIVQVAIGIGAIRTLLDLLWQDQVFADSNILIAFNINDKKIVAECNDYEYVFTNVPFESNGSLNTLELQKQVYNQIIEGVK